MGWLWGKKDKEVPQLEDLSESGKKKDPEGFPKAAKNGDFCKTNSYLDEMMQPIWLEAYQTSDTNGSWKIIKVKLQSDLTNPNKKVQNRSVEKSNLSMYQMLSEMAAFEIHRKVMQPYEEVQENEADLDKGYVYYRRFALYEGAIIDQEGVPHFAPEGKIPEAGHFEVDDVLELQRLVSLPALEKRLVKPNYLRDVFTPVASNINFEEVARQLKTKGYLDELLMNLERARGCLDEFMHYFDETHREESVASWLADIRKKQYQELLPEKFSKYNLTAKTVFESKAFERLQSTGSEAVQSFAAELRDLIEKESSNIQDSFSGSISDARSCVKKLKHVHEDGDVDGKPFDSDPLEKFITALEFTFHIIYAKAQLQYVRHLRGDVEEELEKLSDVVSRAEDKYRKLGAPEEEVARIRSSVLDGAAPQIQPFIAEKLAELKKDVAGLSYDPATPEQMALEMADGKPGVTRYKTAVNLDQLLQDVSEEQRRSLEKEFDLSHLEKLSHLRNKGPFNKP